MAATETQAFWQTRVNRDECVHPPESWIRVNTPLDYQYEDEQWNRIEEWFASDEASGEFCWHYQYYLSEKEREGSMWAFSDPVTAMAFKLRFG